jgi:imidazolonepropionase-like amidohydrolase
MNQLIDGVRLFTGTDESVIEDGAVLIEGDRIRFAGPKAECPEVSGDTKRHHLSGQFVMPGMTETHAHLSFADASPFAIGETGVETATLTAVRNARLMLGSGFTSAVSFGSTYQIDVALREAINAGQVIGPRLRAAGRDLGATSSNVDSPGGLSQIADGPWALRQAVRSQRKIGVDIVKIFIDGENINPKNPPGELSFADEEVHAIVEEAHRRRMRVACHARSAAAVKQAVLAGVDLIGHANYLDDEAVDLLAARRDSVFVGPAIAWEICYLNHCESIGVARQTVIDQGYEREIEATVATVAKLREAGIRMVVGGDYGISIAPHGTYAKDLEYFVEYFDMRPLEALMCATTYGGLAFDPEGSVGTLTAGSMADLVIVDGAPDQNIRVLQNHDLLTVMKGGTLYRDLANPNPYLA